MRWCCWYWAVVGLARMPDWDDDRESRGAASVAEDGCGDGAGADALVEGLCEMEVPGEVGEDALEDVGRNRRVGERAMCRMRAPRPVPFGGGTVTDAASVVPAVGFGKGGGGCVGIGGCLFSAAVVVRARPDSASAVPPTSAGDLPRLISPSSAGSSVGSTWSVPTKPATLAGTPASPPPLTPSHPSAASRKDERRQGEVKWEADVGTRDLHTSVYQLCHDCVLASDRTASVAVAVSVGLVLGSLVPSALVHLDEPLSARQSGRARVQHVVRSKEH
jgi:hypothetical protein